jgi:nucleolar GTP-binding protein
MAHSSLPAAAAITMKSASMLLLMATASLQTLRSSSLAISRSLSLNSQRKLDSMRLRSSVAAALPPSNATQSQGVLRNTGGLRRLPVVDGPTELANRARKAALRVKPDKEIRNMKLRVRKQGAETINALTQALCIPLRDVVKGYKYEWTRLHPFERVVADLTARARQKKDGLTLQQVLDEIHEARKMILDASKDWIAKIKNAETSKEADESIKEGTESLIQLFNDFASSPVSGIIELQKSLRSAPAVQLNVPAVVLVGAPNVGKSSIVRAISSATPEINNYPFTTRGMTLGHVEIFWSENDAIVKAQIPSAKRKVKDQPQEVLAGRYAYSQLCQVMDSPGLLVRPDDERNEMEMLTLAAMQHLPTAVMYVMDLSGEAGDKCSSIEDQLHLRQEMRKRFPRRPWIDVVSKADLGVQDGALTQLESVLDGAPYIQLSIHKGTGVTQLRSEVLRMLGDVRIVLDAMAANNAA